MHMSACLLAHCSCSASQARESAPVARAGDGQPTASARSSATAGTARVLGSQAVSSAEHAHQATSATIKAVQDREDPYQCGPSDRLEVPDFATLLPQCSAADRYETALLPAWTSCWSSYGQTMRHR